MNQDNMTGAFRMNEVNGVRPPYRTGELKINQRRLKRLKNKLWKMCKKRNKIFGRGKSWEDVKIYIHFYLNWHKLKQTNLQVLYTITNSKNYGCLDIHSLYKLMNQTEVNA